MRSLVASSCTLEPLVAAHAPEMFAVLSDPAIYEFENAPPPSEEWLRSRFERLESRESADRAEQWLNWVVRVPGGRLAGYVQATIRRDRTSLVAYELNSRYWRQGVGSSAMRAMLRELNERYEVHTVFAVFRAQNYRSAGLLRKLGFAPASPEQASRHRDDADERVYVKSIADEPDAA